MAAIDWRMRKLVINPPSILLLWTIVLQLFCNIDSYLYAQIGQFDSAAFFMCGKAMMNGLVPYADFADSKGVLLWFIYGLGYLFDHYSYVGVFWMACLSVWGTLMISYKTARLYLEERAALLSAMLLMVPLMYWNFYTETKAEHFCWPAIAWGIYVMMRGIKKSHFTCSTFVWLGVGLIACLMIKWSIALMLMSLVFSCLWISLRMGKLWSSLIALSVGILFSTLPFAIYFTIVDNWEDMWREYFVNTMSTVSIPFEDLLIQYLHEWLGMISTKRFIYLLYTLPILLFWRKSDWFVSALPALCGLFFIALSIRHDQFGHYISVVGPFAILSIVVGIKYCQKWRVGLRYIFACGIVAILYVIWGTIHYSDSFCTKAGARFDQYMAVSAAMSQVEKPKIIIIGQERGLCMGTSLPGTRYWITQMGCTAEMWKEQIAAVEAKTSDFVILFGGESVFTSERLLNIGYQKCCSCQQGEVYSKKLKEWQQESIPHYSVCDIITKKTYLESIQ